jgi:YHS domain-containing protein
MQSRRRFLLVLGTLIAFARVVSAEQPGEPALGGYCPASYLLVGKAVKGDAAYRSVYEGNMYYLADAEAKKQFDADPEKFLPQFGGLCTVALGGSYGNRLPSDPTVFRVVDGKVYLFSVERAVKSFDTKPLEYIATANERFAKPMIGGYCPVSYQLAGKAVKGDVKFKQIIRGEVYHVAGAEAKTAFTHEPDKFIPQYGGFCAEGVARGKRYVGDPTVFAVFDGRTYLFFDAAAKKTFEARPAETIKNADKNWPELRKVKASP